MRGGATVESMADSMVCFHKALAAPASQPSRAAVLPRAACPQGQSLRHCPLAPTQNKPGSLTRTSPRHGIDQLRHQRRQAHGLPPPLPTSPQGVPFCPRCVSWGQCNGEGTPSQRHEAGNGLPEATSGWTGTPAGSLEGNLCCKTRRQDEGQGCVTREPVPSADG